MRALMGFVLGLSVFSGAQAAFAAGGIPHTFDLYGMLMHAFGIPKMWLPTVGGVAVTLVLLLLGLKYRASVTAAGENVGYDGKFSLRYLIDSMLEFIHSVAKENCGDKAGQYYPLLVSIFLFILIANLSGMIPGLPPPTGSMDTNVAIGLVVFIAYNYAGLKEHGLAYFKHFLGPVAFIAPLYLVIEIISHGSRPLSLGLRLMGNIYADHTLLGVFTSLSYVILPSLLMFFGLLVAVVQSFVFTLLTAIYISMATSHDH